jgi:flagellar hook-associated protein 3 FlgL
MAISTRLFTERQLDNFSGIASKIEQNQAKIASGKSISEASEDPEKAIKVSALDERIQKTNVFLSNLNTANTRLGAADTVLSSVSSVLTRVTELAIQGANDTYSDSDKRMIQAEVVELRNELLSLANAKDSQGKPLFSGSTGEENPFFQKTDGSIGYRGNNQRSYVRSTANTTVADSLSGAEIFYSEMPDGKRVSYFDILDNLISSLETSTEFQSSAVIEEPGSSLIKIQSTDRVNQFSFDLVGHFGEVKVEFSTTNNGISDAIQALNNLTAVTGITAGKDQSGQGIVLSNTGDHLEIKNFSDGTEFGNNENQILCIGEDGNEQRVINGLRRVNKNLALINSAHENIALKQATLGALVNQVDSSIRTNENLRDILQISFSDIAAADLEKLITELQSLLVNRDVARQTYTNITQTTLFDFIR